MDYSTDDSYLYWTIDEWMAFYCEIQLNGRLFNQFKSRVHRAYVETYGSDLRMGYRNPTNNPERGERVDVYSPTEFPVLELCYMRTLMDVRCN